MSRNDALIKIYMFLYILITFCGNTLLLNLAPYFIVGLITQFFLLSMVKGIRRGGFFNNKMMGSPILLGLVTLFIGF